MFSLWPDSVFTQSILSGLSLLTIAYAYLNWPYNIFKRLGIPGPKPWPVIGTFAKVEHLGRKDLNNIKKYGKIYGEFEGWLPVLKVADLDSIKQILVKEFHNFTDRRHLPLRGLVKYSVFDVKGETWKFQRAMLSPYFSSGKLKLKVPLILDNADNYFEVFSSLAEKKEPFEAKHLINCFAMDAIASSLFGLNVNAFKDPSNPFVEHGEIIANKFSVSNPLLLLTFFTPAICPFLDKLNFSFIPAKSMNFFAELVRKSIASREEIKDQNKTPDIAQALIKFHEDDVSYVEELEKAGKTLDSSVKRRGMTTDEIIAQGALLFGAGFHTTGSSLSFLLYNLAIHPEIQEKLYQEICKTFPNKETPTYDELMRMEYLEMCICETLRMYPAITMFDRRCGADIEVNGTFIPKDTIVEIPIWALQNDPDYWQDPEKFDPERFNKENKEDRNPYLFMPFGAGPRICIGQRLALLEIKIGAVRFLQHFKFTRTEKTEVPLTFEFSFFLVAKNGLWMGVEKRDA